MKYVDSYSPGIPIKLLVIGTFLYQIPHLSSAEIAESLELSDMCPW